MKNKSTQNRSIRLATSIIDMFDVEGVSDEVEQCVVLDIVHALITANGVAVRNQQQRKHDERLKEIENRRKNRK
jgi:hypothetical protein